MHESNGVITVLRNRILCSVMEVVMVDFVYRMFPVSVLLHFGVESGLVVGGVVNFADGSVGFNEFIETLHLVTLACLVLALDVVGVRVVDFVLELVMRRGLQTVCSKNVSCFRQNTMHIAYNVF